ncbi:MAG: ABC transporter substrate-binding protein [Candidatus Binatia bacterium]
MKIIFILSLLFISTIADAQTRVPRIGVLVQELGRAQSQAIKGLGLELKQLGYSERKHFHFDNRNAKGDRSALQTAAKELVAKPVDVLFTAGTRATLAAIAASQKIPLVFAHPGDPAVAGLVNSANNAAPNVTGVAAYGGETTEKRLALFKEILPALTKIYVFFDANSSTARDRVGLTESAAKKIALQFVGYGVKSADELKTTLSNLNSEAGAAIFQVSDDLVESEAEFIFATARQKKLPTMFNEEAWAIAGATAAYGPSYLEMGRHAARIIDQILKGKAPAAIAVVRSGKFDLTINYRAANHIGLQLPNELLKKADKVIR